MFGLGHMELLAIFLVIIILFGAKRLPELARSLGRSIKEFKNATQGLKDEFDIDKIENKSPNPNAKIQEKPQDSHKANAEESKS